MKKNLHRIIVSELILIAISFPITGYFFGFLTAKVDGWNLLVGLYLRVLSGLLHAFLTIITLGHPWKDESGSHTTDLTVLILLAYIVLRLTRFIMDRKEQKS
jgi:hypothetical protein